MSKVENENKESLEYFNGDVLASDVFLLKYALRDKDGVLIEKTPREMHQRMAKEFARIEKKYLNPFSEDEIFESFDKFKYLVPQGSPMFGIGNVHTLSSISNCFVLDPPKDNMKSIMDTGKTLANIYKRRGGCGFDLSGLRPEGALVSNAARKSTGAWTFSEFYSTITNIIGMAGRRGALMLSLDVKHPDSRAFSLMKLLNKEKVTGANVSLRIRDDFMEAVLNDKEYTLQFPVNSETPTFIKRIKALELWNEIVDAATKIADPGLLFWDTICRRLPSDGYPGFKTVGVNPCSELCMNVDSCRLISVCLAFMVKNPFTDEATFDFEKLTKYVKMATRLADDMVDLELEKLEKIIAKVDPEEKQIWMDYVANATKGRRVGIGTHGIADALARLGVKYDSDEAVQAVESIHQVIKEVAYNESIEMAKERGAFPIFDHEFEKDNEFIKELPITIQEDMIKYGRRNIALLTIAPGGSISLESDCSSSIEPAFRLEHTRSRKLLYDEKDVVESYVDDQGERWLKYEILHPTVRQFKEMFPGKDLPDYFVDSSMIDWKKRIEIQAAAQRHIDHSISSTINLPKGTPSSAIGEIYIYAWKKGLKGVTVYVEGSRTGVLQSKDAKPTDFLQRDAIRRPEILDCDIHHMSVKGQKYIVFVGLLEGKPYEIMGGVSEFVDIPKKYSEGKMEKKNFKTKNGRYDLHVGDDTIPDITKIFKNANNEVFTRMISLALRQGTKVNYLIDQLHKDPDSEFFTFSKGLARVLKKYAGDEKVITDKTCPQCGQEGLINQSGCVNCEMCGYSKCL